MSITADQEQAAREVVDAAGEPVVIAGKDCRAVVGTVAAYQFSDSGYTEGEALTLTLSSSSLPTDADAGSPVTVRGTEYEVLAIESDGPAATLSLR